ncbi:transporter [Streptomyces sp. ADI93-02]|uniref:transporter n=1 Tax=Streptomyces sp. ADI93-02 TaxID=1522757 RepID=UPI001F14EDE6|nr:transporter [Streptomyces sp. ADI93-02]
MTAVAVIAAHDRSGLLDDLNSGLYDRCSPDPLYCTLSGTGVRLLLDSEALKYLGMLNIGLPAIVGMLWGAPLLGRDLEQGTHRTVLTQGVSRGQWLASRLGLAAGTTLVLSGFLAGVFAWWWQPAANQSYGVFWYETAALNGSGPRVVAAALFGLAVGTLLGLLVRRVLPAMTLALLVNGAVILALEAAHRVRFLVPPHTYTSAGSSPKPAMGDKWSAGHYGLITASGRREDVTNCPYPSSTQLGECMDSHGYVARFYEANPAGDYWTFQWTDTLVLGVLTIILTTATTLLLRRRV